MFPTRRQRFSLFGALYFTQGAVMGYFAALQAIYLRSFNLPMTQIGVVAGIATIPFLLKIFLGMLSDKMSIRSLGNRKPYIILGLIIQTISLFIVPSVNPGEQFWSFAALAFVALLGMSLYDTCTDGLALDTTPPHEEGTIQTFMVGGRALGMILGSAILGTLAQYTDWKWAFYMLALSGLVPLPLLLRVREPEREEESTFQWAAFRSMTHGRVLALAVLGAILASSIYGAEAVTNPFLETTYQINRMQAGFFGAIWGLGIVAGGVLGGRMTDDKKRQSRTLRLGILSAVLSVLALACIPNLTLAWVLVFLFGVAFGYYETMYCALSMDVSNRRIAASMFAVLMAVGNVGVGIGFLLSGRLVDLDWVGYRGTFFIMAVIPLAALPLVTRTCRTSSPESVCE